MRWLVHAVVTAHSPCPSHIRMRPDGSYAQWAVARATTGDMLPMYSVLHC